MNMGNVRQTQICSIWHSQYLCAIAAAELANMFAYYKLFPYYDQLREPSKCIYKGPSFAQWAEKNAKALTATVQD